MADEKKVELTMPTEEDFLRDPKAAAVARRAFMAQEIHKRHPHMKTGETRKQD